MKLKEVELTSLDYQEIKDHALRKWLDTAIKDSYNHNTMCIVQSFIDLTISKKLIVRDGKVYSYEKKKST